jgi:ATP-binding cassette subfamily B multidrug efflux pump
LSPTGSQTISRAEIIAVFDRGELVEAGEGYMAVPVEEINKLEAREIREKVAKLNVFQQERFYGMRIIQLFTGEDHQMRSFTDLNHENFTAGMRQIKLFAVFVPVMELFSSFTIALIIWHGGGSIIGEQLSLGSLVAFISYIQMFFKPIRDISEKYNIMQLAMASTERIFESILTALI